MQRRALIIGCAIALTACGATTGTPAPAAKFTTIGGKTFDTASLKGQVTLINFWATSCTTCVKEMPMLIDTYKAFAPKGYRTIAVAMAYDEELFVKQFAASRNMAFDVVYDSDGSIAKAFNDTKLTPTSYLIDKQGNIAKRYVGEPKHDEFKAAIEGLLKA